MLALLSGLFAQLFSTSAFYFVAMKVVMYTLLVTVLPVVLGNWFGSILQGYQTVIGNYVSGGGPSTLIELTGATAGLAVEMGVPTAFAVVASAVAFKVGLRLIPFVRL